MRGEIKALAALAVAWVAQSAPASAQYMPHLDPNLYMLATMNMGGGGDPCMSGTALPDKEIAEARNPAPAVMRGYFRAAQGGGAKSAAFHLDKAAAWRGGGVAVGSAELDRQTDPLAAPGNVLEADPLRFYRSGAGGTALGQWAVLDAQGQVAGVYTALFDRQKKVWKLRELTVSQAGDTVEPVAQYCRKPGDVMEFRLSSTETWRENAQESVDKARARLAAAAAAEARAQAALSAKPRDSRLVSNAREAERELSRATRQLEQREKNLAEASEKFTEARHDAEEIKRLTGEARNALAFRVAATEAESAE
jgi:hypothetical protein